MINEKRETEKQRNEKWRNGKRRNEIKKKQKWKGEMLVTLEMFFWSIKLN